MSRGTQPPPLVGQILERERLVVAQVFRPGPRYWIGRVMQGNRELILKVLLDNTILPSPGGGRDINPARAMSTEIEVFLALRRNQQPGSSDVPELLAYELGGHPWVLREPQPGHSQAAGQGPMMFTESFFRPEITSSLIDYLIGIQELKRELGDLASFPIKYMTPGDYQDPVPLLEPYARPAWEYLKANFEYYDARLDTLTHGQAHPPHIYVNDGRVSMIDWEDAGLRGKMHDFVAAWLRGFMNEPWQKRFLGELRQRGILADASDRRMWQIETLVQAYGILIYFHWTVLETEEEKRTAIDSLKRKVEVVLGDSLILE